MLYAEAKSVREERSRQRYALQDLSLLRVSLVKGKRGWKIGSIEPIKNYYHESVDKAARGSVVNVCRLLRRFVKGEEANTTLFDYVIAALEELRKDHTKRSFVEVVSLVHILSHLGYVDQKQLPAEFHEIPPAEIAKHHTEAAFAQAEKLYTHAVSVSHL